jgi:hypothetical protein
VVDERQVVEGRVARWDGSERIEQPGVAEVRMSDADAVGTLGMTIAGIVLLEQRVMDQGGRHGEYHKPTLDFARRTLTVQTGRVG